MTRQLSPGQLLQRIEASEAKSRKLERSLTYQHQRRRRLRQLLARAQTIPLFAEEVACEH